MECEVPRHRSSAEQITRILKEMRVIAVVGLSVSAEKDSNRVARYLLSQGYEVIPVNPNHEVVLGLKSYPSLKEVDRSVDVVDIFRPSEEVPAIVEEAIDKGTKVIWMQEGIVNNRAADKALSRGLQVVMNRCIMKEHMALSR